MLHAAYKENLKILEDTLCSMCGYSYVFGTYSAVNVTNGGDSVYDKIATIYYSYDNTQLFALYALFIFCHVSLQYRWNTCLLIDCVLQAWYNIIIFFD